MDLVPIGIDTFDSLVVRPDHLDLRGVEGATDSVSFRRLSYTLTSRHPKLAGCPVVLDPRQLARLKAEFVAKKAIKKKDSIEGSKLFGHTLLADAPNA